MAEKTLRELASPDVYFQTLCIQYPNLDTPCVLKSGLIHLLPKFHGLVGEDPFKHLKEFHIVCTTMGPVGIPEDHIKLKAFPFSLQDIAKDWFYYLPPGSVTSWDGIGRMFLEKNFPASRVTLIRKEICGIRQMDKESLYEYWERFKRLCASCPHHQINEQLLIQYFYKGLISIDRQMIDAARGGALVDKTPIVARQLIENMASNNQQFNTRSNLVPLNSGVYEIENTHVAYHRKLEDELDDLASLIKQLALSQRAARLCEIYVSHKHPTGSCPTLYEPAGWMSHPNLKWGNFTQQQQHQPPPQTAAPCKSEPSLEELIREIVVNDLNFQQRTEATIQNLENQIGQLASALNHLQSQGSGNLSAQPPVNLEDIRANTLRLEKTIQDSQEQQPTDKDLNATALASNCNKYSSPASADYAPTPCATSANAAENFEQLAPHSFHSICHNDFFCTEIDTYVYGDFHAAIADSEEANRN
ncbi:uncharacterized protein LOC113859498 [Abrus precatorius]|uniref:Uncharacterized protein LOC113859498 n=1 Tax=Abrus precatorius TaxID=3816 RepID=A0A8B8KVY3_ABRPR|nr:uncharacterized protein LOC113859498 [Abrus precatorius]